MIYTVRLEDTIYMYMHVDEYLCNTVEQELSLYHD